jgi:hypothetical protein
MSHVSHITRLTPWLLGAAGLASCLAAWPRQELLFASTGIMLLVLAVFIWRKNRKAGEA